jgi:predicted phage terminase large subunit-like protein
LLPTEGEGFVPEQLVAEEDILEPFNHYIDQSRQADAEDSLFEYITQAWSILEPVTPFIPNWHIELVCEYLEAVTAGQEKRIIFNLPPRYSKSTIVTVLWPTWEWGPRVMPYQRFVFSSYAASLSQKHARDRLLIIQSDWYQRRWGSVFRLKKVTEAFYDNDARGHMLARSTAAVGTGLGGSRIVIDDPHNTREAESDAERGKANDDFDLNLSRRLDNKITDPIIVVMQRLHDQDLTGHLLEAPGFTHVKIQGEARHPTTVVFPQSGRTIAREQGDLLCREREGPAEIEEAKLRLGRRGFASQYDQEPNPEGGLIFMPALYRRYKILPPLARMIGSWDTAFKQGQENDFCAFSLWGQATREYGGRLYLLYMLVVKMTLPELKRRVRQTYQQGCPLRYVDGLSVPCNLRVPDVLLVEDASSGTAIIQEMGALDWEEIAEGRGEGDRLTLPIQPISVGTDKIARANAATPMLESGFAMLPDAEVYDVPWLEGLVYSMEHFPSAVHDDDIDCVTQALNFARLSDEPGILGYYRRQAEEIMRQKEGQKNTEGQPATPDELLKQKKEEESAILDDDDEHSLEDVYKEAVEKAKRVGVGRR